MGREGRGNKEVGSFYRALGIELRAMQESTENQISASYKELSSRAVQQCNGLPWKK
jgi:hypothetical protein